jgi:hypothetical protein
MSAASAAASPRRRRLVPGPDQLALRAVVVLGAVLALAAADLAGAEPGGWVTATVVVLAAVTALRPESVAGVLALAGTAYAWALGPDPLSPLLLLVAAGMLLLHLAALVAGQAPALAAVDPRQLWLWGRRGVVLWLAAVVVWGLAVLVEDHAGGRATYAGGLLLLAAVAVLGTREVSRRVG